MADQTTEELWEVKEILDKRGLMKWADFDSKYNSWEPVKNFNKKLIAEYEESRKNQTQGVEAAPNAPTAQAAAPIIIPAVGPVRPVAAPAADPANGNDIVTGEYLVGCEVTEILGMGLADIETNGGLTQLRCYRCRFDDGCFISARRPDCRLSTSSRPTFNTHNLLF